MEKRDVAAALGEEGLLVPQMLKDALAANDRAKFYLSLLQLARMHADAPDAPVPSIAADRERAGIADTELDRVIERTRSEPPDAYRIPRYGRVVRATIDDVKAMIAPLHALEGETSFDARLGTFDRPPPPEIATADEIERLTGADRARDSLHLLVVDVHKALDDVAARRAVETIGGASVWGVEPDDRALIEAFAEGVQRTQALKLRHPGLGTAATRYGGALVIENDIGATDAHVIVIRVTDSHASITATDVHVQRLAFLEKLLEPHGVAWDNLQSLQRAQLNEGDAFFRRTGTFQATSREALAAFLRDLGASLVFLIDWNRARKQLQSFVSKRAAVDLLHWAATERVGHCAFLEEGGAELVFRAMASVMQAPMRFGERLVDVLGAEPASSFLRFVLRESTSSRLEGRSRALLRERIRAELASQLASLGERLLEPVLRHAQIVRDLADDLHRAISTATTNDLAGEAKRREHEADDVLVETRAIVVRITGTDAFQKILEAADDAADAIEEGSFRSTLLRDEKCRATLVPLAAIALRAAETWTLAVELARRVSTGASEDAQRFLEAVDRLIQLEREADVAERTAARAFVCEPVTNAGALVFATAVASELEKATDALEHAALLLRDYLI